MSTHLNLVEAGGLAGVSKSAILKAIKRGRLSAHQDALTKGWQIEPAELYRVYPPGNGGSTPDNPPDNRLLEEVRARLEDAHAQIRDLQERLTRSDLRVTALLSPPVPAARGWKWWKR